MDGKSIVVLGNFDGVHIGHQALIAEGQRLSDKLGLSLIVWTFDTIPSPAITSVSNRETLLRSYGVDRVVTDSFASVKGMSCSEFVSDVLVKKLNCGACVCGYNYSFGKGGVGTPAMLTELCRPLGIEVSVVDRVTLNGEDVSSTRVRGLLSDGNVTGACELMGRYYFLTGTVEKGAEKGRTLGIPTANLYPVGRCLPKNGVYATVTTLPDGRRLPSVTNVGERPTLDDSRGISAETYIIDFEGDLYGKEIRVDFIEFIRSERRFPSLTALSEATKDDILKAKSASQRVISEEKK